MESLDHGLWVRLHRQLCKKTQIHLTPVGGSWLLHNISHTKKPKEIAIFGGWDLDMFLSSDPVYDSWSSPSTSWQRRVQKSRYLSSQDAANNIEAIDVDHMALSQCSRGFCLVLGLLKSGFAPCRTPAEDNEAMKVFFWHRGRGKEGQVWFSFNKSDWLQKQNKSSVITGSWTFCP